VPYQAGVDFMKEHNMHFFFETSAFEGKNVELVIQKILFLNLIHLFQ